MGLFLYGNGAFGSNLLAAGSRTRMDKKMGRWPIFCWFRRVVDPGRMECLTGATES